MESEASRNIAMVPLDYWLLRLARRNTPQPLVDFLLDRGIYLKPGRDTSDPAGVARFYAERAAAHGRDLAGRRVCVVGYGGGLGVGLHLLEAGAAHVVLQDPFAPTRSARNRGLSAAVRGRWLRDGRPDPERIELVHEPLERHAARHPASADLVVSNSVLEHVADLDALAGACARVTAEGGLNVHVVDLRDHFFKYPFEMLCYSEQTWSRWLDASNHLNRLRLRDYRRIFAGHFPQVDITVTQTLREEFRRARTRIRPEFLTGDDEVDAASQLHIVC